ncbi:nitrilase-related carbon-nitrogen hydrolase [Streptomyces sp. NBC_01314]|uniref:nitrilase-related carbon-nitrogen hydrolase n=1 Tax=Streptomyces sp. NBC_01314 TaxID=2903821 RepID=UPI00352D7657
MRWASITSGLRPALTDRVPRARAPLVPQDVAVPNRVGREDNEYGELAVDFYGTSYVADPLGNFAGGKGSSTSEELLLRDLDMDLIRKVRNAWQFYRGRRPEAYGAIVAP